MKAQGSASIYKAMMLLEYVAAHPGLGLAEISRNTKTPKATTHRILSSLLDQGAVRQVAANSGYVLGPTMIRLGSAARNQIDLIRLAHPHLLELSQEFDETAHLSIYDRGAVMVIDRVEAGRGVRAWSPVGERLPLHAGSSSRCIAAYLDHAELQSALPRAPYERFTDNTPTTFEVLAGLLEAVREAGYCATTGEVYDDVSAVSVPVFDDASTVVAALTLGGPAVRFDEATIVRQVERLSAHAQLLSIDLGFPAPRGKGVGLG